MTDTMIERATNAAWEELERQGQVNKADAPYVDREALLIDGHVDLPAIVRAVLTAMREPTIEMIIECGDLPGSQQEMWQRSIDAALAEGA